MAALTSPDLEAIFASAAGSVRERELRAADLLDALHAGPTVLVGAGGLGERLGAVLLERGLPVTAYADARRRGSSFLGVPVLSHEEAVGRWGGHAQFVVAIWNGDHSFVATRGRLGRLGCRRVVSWLEVARLLGPPLLPQYAAGPATTVSKARNRVIAQEHVWADDVSTRVYAEQVAWRLSGDFDDLGGVQPDQYFPRDIVRLREAEVMADCGAYTGDTVIDFVARMPDFRAVHAFEPDAINTAALAETIRVMNPGARKRIRLYALATGAESGLCGFRSGRGPSSGRVVDSGPGGSMSEVACARLDDVLDGAGLTFIKMDVEGAEAATLKGARRILSGNRPLLAIAAYHGQADLWELPSLVDELTEDYQLYLRAHRNDGFECVLYGVPSERRM